MLKRLNLLNFKSVANASLELGLFTFLVGRNGSGKSNIADALARQRNGRSRRFSTAAVARARLLTESLSERRRD